jgi:hypothetical protein
MALRRLLPFLILALMLAPMGRMGMAEAAPAHAMAMQSGGHCPDMPAPAGAPDRDGMGIDCAIACAAMHAAAAPFVVPALAVPDALRPVTISHRAGIRPEAEPPPPRRS